MMTTVLASPERRRRWTSAEKLRIVEESLSGQASVAEVARRNDVHPNLVHAWRRQARAGALASDAAGGCRFASVLVTAGDGAPPSRTSEASAEPAIEVMLRNGRVLRLPAGVAPGRVGALADALEGLGR